MFNFSPSLSDILLKFDVFDKNCEDEKNVLLKIFAKDIVSF